MNDATIAPELLERVLELFRGLQAQHPAAQLWVGAATVAERLEIDKGLAARALIKLHSQGALTAALTRSAESVVRLAYALEGSGDE